MTNSPDHSGVAGEPEATTKEACCPEFARNGYSHTEICPAFDTAAADPAVAVAERRAIESLTDKGAEPAAVTTAGRTMVSVEIVEAAAEALRSHQWNIPPEFPSIWRLSEHRSHTFDARCAVCGGDVDEIVRVVVAAAAPLIAAQALRSAAEKLQIQIGTHWGMGDAVIHLLRRADELERGADR